MSVSMSKLYIPDSNGLTKEVSLSKIYVNENGLTKLTEGPLYINKNGLTEELNIGFKWKEDTRLSKSFMGGAAVVYDDKIHLVGGNGNSSHLVYDGETWSDGVFTISQSVYDILSASVVVFNGYIHLLGVASSNKTPKQYTLHYYWDKTMSNWFVQSEPLPYSCNGNCSVVYDGRIHLLGGGNTFNHYRLVNTSWQQVSTIPTGGLTSGFNNGKAVVYDGKIHLIGTSYHYSWNGSSWTQESEPPYDPYLGCAVVYGGKIHILGGGNSAAQTKFHYSWDSTKRQWKEESVLPVEFYRGQATEYNGKLHILGGRGYSSFYATANHYSGK